MISRMLGAPLGGTTVAGQPGLEPAMLRLALPAKGVGGFGIYRPSMVVVAAGELGVPVVWPGAWTEGATAIKAAANIPLRRICFVSFIGLFGLMGCLVSLNVWFHRWGYFAFGGKMVFQSSFMLTTVQPWASLRRGACRLTDV